LKTYKGYYKNNDFQISIIHIPGHLIEVNKYPEKATDQRAVQEMENAVNKGTTFPQVHGKKWRHERLLF
jgi:23S rRNA maturation-related 3'-5' exoribonuclease YhaM